MRDDRLKRWSGWLKMRANRGEPLEKLLPDAFAGAREAAKRALGLDAFSCQMLAGLMMHRGRIAEMATGEGKTLAAIFPAYLNALTGKGVHILTFNDYLAKRDAAWMGPVFDMLDIKTAAVYEGLDAQGRREAYKADITYLTVKEAGFDYLRDAIAPKPEDRVHRPFHMAIVDEADSILIDEARIPLVIAGRFNEETPDPNQMAQIVFNLQENMDYAFDEYRRNVFLTESGLKKAEELLGLTLHDEENLQVLSALNLALHAATLLQRDVDYIVKDNTVACIDPLTGRIADKRRWPNGLHAALEAREKVAIRDDGQVLGSISIQHFTKLYPRLAGMTATAQAAEQEFAAFYDLHITVIPSNKPCIRKDHPNLVFTDQPARDAALVKEICKVHKLGRPVLIGASDVRESELLATQLRAQGLKPQVLNAKTDELEAEIIAQAGAPGALTISTNMAGRGVDIKLGGADEAQRDQVLELGGLYVLGACLWESRRIDDQLRGRAGRQGDPGESRFFTSLQDPLMKRFNVMPLLPKRYRTLHQEEPVTSPIVLREVNRIQRIIEGQSFEIRKTLWSYASVLEQQRKIHDQRRCDILEQDINGDDKEWILLQLDHFWMKHIALADQLRDGIHLARYGGMDPLMRFRKEMDEAFESFKPLDSHQVSEYKEAFANLKRPTSTWTYLAGDNPFSQDMRFSLMGSSGVTYAIFAFFSWPLILAGAFLNRFFGKSK